MSSSKDNSLYKKTSFLEGANSAFIEELYSDYLKSPEKIPEEWKLFFDGLKDDKEIINKNLLGPSWAPKKIKKEIKVEVNVEEKSKEIYVPTQQSTKDSIRAIMLIRAYRIRGHLISNLDPLGIQKREEHPELKPETYGFMQKDFNRKIFLDGVLGLEVATLNEILSILKKTYCSNIGYEFMHMGDPEEKSWIRDRVEGKEKEIRFTINGKKAI